jgi:hypothetical protein
MYSSTFKTTAREAALLLATVSTLSVLAMQTANAHAVAGARVFVNTLVIDDPGVADEASLPVLAAQSPDGKTTDISANVEYDKTIFSNVALGVGTSYDFLIRDYADNNKSHGGFGNPYAQLKYRWIVLPEHEFISSVAVRRDFGRAGTPGFDDGYNSTTFSGYFGKGLGDIPYTPIRPFAITGELDYTVPDAGVGAGGGGSIQTWSGGLTLQYSIPYLESQIHDYDLPTVLANLTPLVELGWSSAAGRSAITPANYPTTFVLGTGAVWTGTYYSFSTEVLWPLNGATAHGLGIIGQFHLYFDDMFPNSIGKPLFGA